MVNRDLLASKLAELADRVARIRECRKDTVTELAADRDAAELVSFNLMLALQACADIASHLVADEGWAAARTLAEGFTRLEQQGVIAAPVAGALRSAVGLRNVVAHGYAGVDLGVVHRAATEGLEDLDAFARSVAAWAAPR
jgi:uncharacterized protein YutE (UPF0331/DUF86 family)